MQKVGGSESDKKNKIEKSPVKNLDSIIKFLTGLLLLFLENSERIFYEIKGIACEANSFQLSKTGLPATDGVVTICSGKAPVYQLLNFLLYHQ